MKHVCHMSALGVCLVTAPLSAVDSTSSAPHRQRTPANHNSQIQSGDVLKQTNKQTNKQASKQANKQAAWQASTCTGRLRYRQKWTTHHEMAVGPAGGAVLLQSWLQVQDALAQVAHWADACADVQPVTALLSLPDQHDPQSARAATRTWISTPVIHMT